MTSWISRFALLLAFWILPMATRGNPLNESTLLSNAIFISANPSSCAHGAPQQIESVQSRLSQLPLANPEIGTSYRRTKNGWEDSSKWWHAHYSVSSFFGRIHPLIWAAAILCLALLSLLGLSNDSEVDRFIHDLDIFFSRESSTT
jgi:hypothetical protein